MNSGKIKNTPKSLTLNGMTVPHALLVIMSLGMLGSSIYLMGHFFQTFYPIGLAEGQICQTSGFFSCDAAAYSPVSAIFGVPNALYGILAGCFLLYSSFFPRVILERTNRTLTMANAIGCIVLFFYSIIILGHLCPGCTVYYFFSIAAAYLFHRYGGHYELNIKVIGSYAVIFLLSLGILFYSFKAREEQQQEYRHHVINQFKTFGEFGDPQIDSPFRLASATDKFSEAPLRISVFSDFQCPYCSILANSMERVMLRFQGKINIQYFHYPLDASCNPNMDSAMHPFACRAANLTACRPQDFKELHDQLFAKGRDISSEWLDDLAVKYQSKECIDSAKSKEVVSASIQAAKQYDIRSTPTLIINGRKVEGSLSSTHLSMILDYLLEQK